MKKSIKFVTITAIVAVILLLTLTGCSTTPYDKYLNIKWDKSAKEVATYNYTYEQTGKDTINGKLTTTIFEAKGQTFKIGNQEFTDIKDGAYYEYKLEVENGDTVFGQVYFKGYQNQFFRPIASYSKKVVGSNVTETQTTYSHDKCTTVFTNNGKVETLSTNINKKGIVFDNIQLHAIARTLNFSQNGQLAFQTPIYEKDSLYAKNVAMGAAQRLNYNIHNKEDNVLVDKTYEFINEGKEFGAVAVILTINEKPAGIPQRIVVADKAYSINGTTFDQPIIRIEEGEKSKGLSTYVLTDMVKVAF